MLFFFFKLSISKLISSAVARLTTTGCTSSVSQRAPTFCFHPRRKETWLRRLPEKPFIADEADKQDFKAVTHLKVLAFKVPGHFWQHYSIRTMLICCDGLQATAITIQIAFSFRSPTRPSSVLSLLFSWRWALVISSSEATFGMKTSTVTYHMALSQVIFRPFLREFPVHVSI